MALCTDPGSSESPMVRSPTTNIPDRVGHFRCAACLGLLAFRLRCVCVGSSERQPMAGIRCAKDGRKRFRDHSQLSTGFVRCSR